MHAGGDKEDLKKNCLMFPLSRYILVGTLIASSLLILICEYEVGQCF